MNCEVCGERPAQRDVTVEKAGETHRVGTFVLHVCNQCALWLVDVLP